MDALDAEVLLAKTFQWKGWASATPLMRKWMTPQVPNVATLQEGFDWLTMEGGPLELSQDQLRTAVLHSPKTYLMNNPESTYHLALQVAPKDVVSTPSDFKALILKDPAFLQVTYNCSDEGCQSECGSCWVTYMNRT